MAVTATGPDGAVWKVQRSLLRGRDGHGRRVRWRGPSLDALELGRLMELGDLADVPVIGAAAVAIAVLIGIVLLLLFLPAIALGLVQVLLISLLFVIALVAATVFGRPILVRAVQPATGASTVWAVKGWAASRSIRDAVVTAVQTGADPRQTVEAGLIGGDAVLIAHRDRLDEV